MRSAVPGTSMLVTATLAGMCVFLCVIYLAPQTLASTASALVLTSRPTGSGLGHGRLAGHLGLLAGSCPRPGQLGSASPAPRISSPR